MNGSPREKDGKSLSLLHHAAATGNLQKLKISLKLLRSGVNSTAGSLAQTALHKSAKYGHIKCALYLLEAGADIEFRDAEGRTALAIAAFFGEMEMVKLLISNGANVDSQDNKKKNIVMHALYSLRPGEGKSPKGGQHEESQLELIKNKEALRLVKYLTIECNANLELLDNSNNTVVHVACRHRRADCLEFLVMRVPGQVLARNCRQELPLHFACTADLGGFNDCACVEVLLKHGGLKKTNEMKNEKGKTPLDLAALTGCEQEVSIIFIRYILVELAKHCSTCTTVMTAAERGHRSCLEFVLPYLSSVNKIFNDVGESLLYVCVERAHLPCVKYLVEELDADVNLKNDDLKAPVHAAAERKNVLMIKYLVAHGANIDVFGGKLDKTPLQIAMESGSDEFVADMLDEKINANPGFNNGVDLSMLHIACQRNNNTKVVSMLLESKKTNMMTLDSHAQTPLMYVVSKAGKAAFATVKLLIDFYAENSSEQELKAYVDTADLDGNTALHYCAFHHHFECLKYLIEMANANPLMMNDRHLHPIHIAVRSEDNECIRFLVLNKGMPVVSDLVDNRWATPYEVVMQGSEAYLCLQDVVQTPLKDCECKDVWNAARLGHIKCLREVLPFWDHRCIDEEKDEKKGNSMFELALENGHFECVKLIVDDMRANIYNSRTLQLAIGHVKDPRFIRFFLDKGVDVNGEFVDDSKGTKLLPIHKAAGLGMTSYVCLLLDHNAPIDSRNAQGRTAIHYAAMYDHPHTLKVLLERKATVDAVDTTGFKGIHLAAKYDNVEALKFLMKKDFDIQDDENYSQIYSLAGDECKKWLTVVEANVKQKVKNTENIVDFNEKHFRSFIATENALFLESIDALKVEQDNIIRDRNGHIREAFEKRLNMLKDATVAKAEKLSENTKAELFTMTNQLQSEKDRFDERSFKLRFEEEEENPEVLSYDPDVDLVDEMSVCMDSFYLETKPSAVKHTCRLKFIQLRQGFKSYVKQTMYETKKKASKFNEGETMTTLRRDMLATREFKMNEHLKKIENERQYLVKAMLDDINAEERSQKEARQRIIAQAFVSSTSVDDVNLDDVGRRAEEETGFTLEDIGGMEDYIKSMVALDENTVDEFPLDPDMGFEFNVRELIDMSEVDFSNMYEYLRTLVNEILNYDVINPPYEFDDEEGPNAKSEDEKYLDPDQEMGEENAAGSAAGDSAVSPDQVVPANTVNHLYGAPSSISSTPL
eukprot:Nk52_evm3s243 gene=Nk52_evmTU3s243